MPSVTASLLLNPLSVTSSSMGSIKAPLGMWMVREGQLYGGKWEFVGAATSAILESAVQNNEAQAEVRCNNKRAIVNIPGRNLHYPDDAAATTVAITRRPTDANPVVWEVGTCEKNCTTFFPYDFACNEEIEKAYQSGAKEVTVQQPLFGRYKIEFIKTGEQFAGKQYALDNDAKFRYIWRRENKVKQSSAKAVPEGKGDTPAAQPKRNVAAGNVPPTPPAAGAKEMKKEYGGMVTELDPKNPLVPSACPSTKDPHNDWYWDTGANTMAKDSKTGKFIKGHGQWKNAPRRIGREALKQIQQALTEVPLFQSIYQFERRPGLWMNLSNNNEVHQKIELAFNAGSTQLDWKWCYRRGCGCWARDVKCKVNKSGRHPDNHQYTIDFTTMTQIDLYFPRDPRRTKRIRRVSKAVGDASHAATIEHFRKK